MGNNITLTAADGFELGAYEAIPAGDAKGAVVVIQEIFGVNQHIREVTDGYAQAGFYAIAPKIRLGQPLESFRLMSSVASIPPASRIASRARCRWGASGSSPINLSTR